MDLLESLRTKLNILPDGDHSAGLRAVLVHVEAAFKHLSRGQELTDESLFTDAVYRTNQAFEGSIKEAYRVLAGSDPAKLRPFGIETYLDKHKIFKARDPDMWPTPAGVSPNSVFGDGPHAAH